jgi:hypothetical protein
MNVFVAAPFSLRKAASRAAWMVHGTGHVFVSQWHEVESLDPLACRREMLAADAVLLLYGPLTAWHEGSWLAGYGEGLGLGIHAVPAARGARLPADLLRWETVKAWRSLGAFEAHLRSALVSGLERRTT